MLKGSLQATHEKAGESRMPNTFNLFGLCSFIMSDTISEIYSSQSIGDIAWLMVKGYLKPSLQYINRKNYQLVLLQIWPKEKNLAWIDESEETPRHCNWETVLRSYCCTRHVSKESIALLKLRFDFSATRAANPAGSCRPSFFAINSNTLTIWQKIWIYENP